MLIGISPLISRDLMAILDRMGHGEEIVLADPHEPGETFGNQVLRADGRKSPVMLDVNLPLIAFDTYAGSPVIMMSAASDAQRIPTVEISYRQAIDIHCSNTPPIEPSERFDIYNRAKQASAALVTGETVEGGNIISKKRVTPIAQE